MNARDLIASGPSGELRAQLAAVERERAVRHFRQFVRYMWRTLEPVALDESWYIDVFCDHLEALTFKQHPTRKLLANAPPRHIKSNIYSVFWPAWEWLHDPTLRYVTAAYDFDLATRDAVKSRGLMESERYRMLMVHAGVSWEFSTDQNVKTRFENSVGGARVVVSVGSRVTGFGGERLLGDDLHNVMDAENEDALKRVIDWYEQAFRNRVNDERTAVRVIGGQRVAEQDISGHLLATDPDFDHLCLPFLHETGRTDLRPTMLGYVDPRRIEGEPLVPVRWGPKEVAGTKPGTRYYDTQWQQRPRAKQGVIFKRADFKRWIILPPRWDAVIISSDLSFKGTPKEEIARVADLSMVVHAVWGFYGADAYLLDEERGQWDFLRALKRFAALCIRWPQATRKIIEPKANGPALVSILKRKIPGLDDTFEPQGSKIQRAYGCQPFVESGNVHVPANCSWVDEPGGWLDEVEGFPNYRWNDRVDAMTQVLLYYYARHGSDALERMRRLTSVE